MSIVAVCPHCEARFNLQDELAGKVMRCPNPDCREVFTVPAAAPVPPPPPPEPAPRKKAGTRDIGDVLPVVDARPARGAEPALPSDEVVDAEPVTLPPPPPARPKKRPPEPAVVDAVVVSKPKPGPAVVDAVVVAPPAGVVDAVAVGPPKVKEVVWSPNADVPPPPGAREEPDDEPFILPKRRRKKKTNLPVYILIGMASTIVILGGAFALIYLQRTAGAEARSARDAEDQYKAGDYSAAAKAFSELATSYPASDNRPKYEFYSALATLQRDVRSVATRDDPGPAVTKVLAFLDAHKDSPFVKPDDGPGADVLAAGRKVAEDAAGHAEDRVKEYRRDRTKADDLRKAAESVARGRELVRRLDPLRAPAAEPFDGLRLRFDQVSRDIDSETRRSQGMAEIRALIEKPTDASVEAARAKLAEYGLTADPEAARLVADAGGMLGRLVRYVPAPRPPVKPPGGYAGALAFAAPVGPTVPAVDTKPGVFLAVGRGVVYAFDEETGAFLWAARVGAGVNEPPAVATVDSPAGPAAVAVVVSHVGGTPAVAGHDLRTGAVRWYQPLPAAPAGPAVVVGTRAYAAVRDADGTLVEIDVTTGAKLGQVTLGQPLGPPPVLRPGTGLIYLVADARRVYVLDAANRDVEGNRLPPRCAQVLLTGHAPGSVRTAPLVIGPAGDAPADRWLVTAHATTPGETQLRAFPLPPLAPPTADGLAPPGVSVAAAASVSVPGWVWLPPATDGERLGLATDAAEFRLFGVNQPGNRDPALFPIPQATGASRADVEPVPGLAFPADDAAFWVLAGGGEVQRVRVGLDPAKGLVATPVARPRQPGRATLAGVPTQPVVLHARGDTAFLVVRPPNSATPLAVAFDVAAGEVRWQRQLGVDFTAAAGTPTGGAVLAGDGGGVATLPADGPGVEPGTVRAADPTRLAYRPLDAPSGKAQIASSADGQTRFVISAGRTTAGDVLAVRKLTGTRPAKDARVRVTALPAGPAVVFGGTVAFPAADGFVYRVAWAEPAAKDEDGFDKASLVRGPQWRTAETRNPAGVCFLTPLDGDRLAVTDADRTVTVWSWPAGGTEQPTGFGWALPRALAQAPLFLPGGEGQGRILIADASGTVWLYAADRAGEPLRRWRPDGAKVPAGPPTSAFATQSAPDGKALVAYVVDGRHVLVLNPDADGWDWVAKGEDRTERVIVGAPQPAGNGKWLVTDLGGRVSLLDAAAKQRGVAGEVGLPGVVPVAPAVMSGPGRAAVPLSDGTAAVVAVPGA